MKGVTAMTAAPPDLDELETESCAERAIRHRRRGPALERAIHEAVLAELSEIGYAGLTIESVASRARTGKASIYRRWPTKQQLVMDAFCASFGETLDLLDGSLAASVTTRDALVHVGQKMAKIVADSDEAMRAAACEMNRDPKFAAIFEEQVACPKREALLGVLQRGVARGEVRPEAATELYAEILPSMIMARLIVQNRPIADDFLIQVVDDVVMPLLTPDLSSS
jgi:AcrR family transcriptional regulator